MVNREKTIANLKVLCDWGTERKEAGDLLHGMSLDDVIAWAKDAATLLQEDDDEMHRMILIIEERDAKIQEQENQIARLTDEMQALSQMAASQDIRPVFRHRRRHG